MDQAAVLAALEQGEVTVQGEFLWGSNYTFFVQVAHADLAFKAVYKPTRGERPLWDFPTATLAHREAAAYLVSEALGWGLVPPTVYRRRGLPAGPGSLQVYIDHDPEYHYFKFSPEDRQRLRPTVLFDLLVNNADRKGSHVLVDPENHLWLIDHGICFHVEDKLRTVIWDFASESIPAALLTDLGACREQLSAQPSALALALKPHLSRGEVRALAARAAALLAAGIYPLPDPKRRPIPWPPI